VLGKRGSTPIHVIDAADKHREAFDLFLDRQFAQAKELFNEVSDLMSPPLPCGSAEELSPVDVGDRLSHHLGSLCDKYWSSPPPNDWDGAEHLKKKAW